MNRIEHFRKMRGLTQEQLGDRMTPAQNQGQISRKESQRRGAFDLKELEQIADILGVEPWQLVRGSDSTDLTDDERALIRDYRAIENEGVRNFVRLNIRQVATGSPLPAQEPEPGPEPESKLASRQ